MPPRRDRVDGQTGAKSRLAAVIDLYSRYCVGWAVSAVNDRHLTMRALEMAIRRRCPEAGLSTLKFELGQDFESRSATAWEP